MKVLIFALLPAVALCQLGGMAGGISETTISATAEPVLFAVKAVNNFMGKNSEHQLSLVNVVHASTQVVAGQKLFLTLQLTEGYSCDVTVWYRQWLHGADRLVVTDGPTCRKHVVQARTGGIGHPQHLPQGSNDATQAVQGALKFAACAMNDRENSFYASTLGDVSGVTFTHQVTSGITYRFYNVPIVTSDCQNKGCADTTLDSCNVQTSGLKRTCSFTVQDQAWMPVRYTLIDLHC
ncbi:hypothetical protein ACOMHN_040835 [Nucella lapillus]